MWYISIYKTIELCNNCVSCQWDLRKHYLYPHFQTELQRRWALPNKLSEWYTVSNRNKTIYGHFISEPQTNSEEFLL